VNKKRILSSSLPKEGSRFVILTDPKDGSITPHSTGYIAYYDPAMSGNVNRVKAHIILTRRGKTGMDRLEKWHIFLPVYHTEELHEMLLASTPKYYVNIDFSNVNERHDLRTIKPLDFLAWAVCRINMLKVVNMWFSDRKGWPHQTLNGFETNVLSRFKNSASVVEDIYASYAARVQIINLLRAREAEQVKTILSYHKAMVRTHIAALNWLSSANTFMDDDDKPSERLPSRIISDTVSVATQEHTGVLALMTQHNMKI